MSPSPNTWVTPVVRLTRPLRRGGMGAVWLAHHKTLETDVVVKFLATTLCYDEPSRGRFAREATAAAKVKSPHVVQTLDHGVTDDGTPFIVMEHLEGEDLGQRLRKQRLSLSEVASVVEQVSRALDAAHRHGVIHRDVKPGNIYLTDVGAREPFVKLLDFGVAKTIQNQTLTTSGELLGTPVYMSPEQITGGDLDARSDLWALAVVAFRCLTGKRPFDGDGVAAVAYQVVHAPLPMPSALSPEVPPAVDRWFAQACNRDREQRFGSARAMADALWAAMDMDRASDWSGETPPPLRSAVPVADAETVVEGRASQRSLTDRGALFEPTGGSLGSSVATLPPHTPVRGRTLLMAAAIPIAVAAGYGMSEILSTMAESEPVAPTAMDAARSESLDAATPPPKAATAISQPKPSASAPPSAAAAAPKTPPTMQASSAPPAAVHPTALPPPRPQPAADPGDLGF